MKALDTNLPSASRRGPVRMDQDGPWSVSVAETPYDTHSYSLYIKTPTHNITLTRTSTELVELDLKLRHSSTKIPTLPINPDSLPAPPPKRKSTFLNTLSRLASPTSAKSQRRLNNASSAHATPSPLGGAPGLPPIPTTTPLTSPAREANDPFVSFGASSTASTGTTTPTVPNSANGDSSVHSSFLGGESGFLGGSSASATSTGNSTASADAPASPAAASATDASGQAQATSPTTPSATSTALAAYLTTISNIPQIRADRVWKRFVRVRTDDLESVRVERAIKRVRSDLAAHTGGGAGAAVGGPAGNGVVGNLLSVVGVGGKENATKSVPTTPPNASMSEAAMKESLQAQSREESERDSELAASAAALEEVKQRLEDENQAEEVKNQNQVEGHPSKEKNVTEETVTQEDVGENEVVPEGSLNQEVVEEEETTVEGEVADKDDGFVPSTPLANTSDIPSRIPRSQSAEPDKRFSRSFTSSVPSQSGAESQTGDESSSSFAPGGNSSAVSSSGGKRSRRRKARSSSRAHKDKDASSTTTTSKEPRKSQRKVVIDDFEMMRVLGKGCAGKVLLVKHKNTADLFALKAITKRHVLAHQELQHTLTEQAVLKRMAAEGRDPFVVKLWWSFHDKENLFLVMDFHPGGDLATQLARWGRLGRDRARFYAAEIVEGCEGLHAAGVIYRDLKPENILIGGDGHIVLTDFGLSKEFPRPVNTANAANGFYSSVPGTPQPATPPWMKADRNGEMALGWPGQPIGHTDSTTTFCGTAEYLAPEVIQGLPYSYEVDWWSFGTMLYEMLTGITPFWANNHSDMYVRVLQDELQFPDDRAIDQDTKSLIRGLLQRVPTLRICEPRIKKHPYFSMIDWSHVYYKRYIPPYIPPIDPSNASDTQNFDDTFLDMEPVLDEYNDDGMDTDQEPNTDTERTDGEESNTTPSQSRSSSIRPQAQKLPEDDVDVFDGYSFKGRHSVLIDDDDEEEDGSEGTDESLEEDDDESLSILKGLPPSAEPDGMLQVEEDEGLEPKTPEARPVTLPPVSEPERARHSMGEEITEARRSGEIKEESGPSKRKSRDIAAALAETGPPPPPKPQPSRQPGNIRTARPRKERSGVPALDRYLSDAIDEDAEATEAEREDDDWDFIEAGDGEDRNGAKGTSYFARGVVDKYRLKVFGKTSTPSRQGQRTASGMSMASDSTAAESPSNSPSQRRGRTPLTFRKHPRQFLRAKSPPTSFSAKSARSLSNSATPSQANTMSAASTSSMSMGGLLTPSMSVSSNTFANSPSLKSKESAMSVGAQSHSSDQSNGQSAVMVEAPDATRMSPQQDQKQKKMKLKKYKNNAEKVLSLFSSPRQNQL